MGVNIREINKRLYLDYTVNGHRHTESIKIKLSDDERQNKELRRLAEIIRVKKLAQIVSNENGLIDQVEGKRTLISYAEGLASKQLPKNSLPKSLKYLREYAGSIKLEAVTTRWVEEYREFLLAQSTLGEATASKYLESIKSVLRSATRNLILSKNPAESVKGITVPDTLQAYLNEDELRRLEQTPLGGKLGAEVKRAFLFGYLTGLRISDLIELKWGDIHSGVEWQISKLQQKTGGLVVIPLNEDALGLIDIDSVTKHLPSDLVFPRLSQSKTNTNQYLVSWGEKAGIQTRLGWHVTRRTFGTLALASGTNPFTVQKLLGHKKISTTMKYAQSTDSLKRSAVDNLPSIYAKKEEGDE